MRVIKYNGVICTAQKLDDQLTLMVGDGKKTIYGKKGSYLVMSPQLPIGFVIVNPEILRKDAVVLRCETEIDLFDWANDDGEPCEFEGRKVENTR